jgi:signal transduction histidine kinase/DNA-binding response OmpR family regulator
VNLRETTQKNTEQDWLKSNLAKFTRMVQGQKDLVTFSRLVLSELAPLVGAQHGVFYLSDSEGDRGVLKLFASYAFRERKTINAKFAHGEGLVGQCALEKERILVTQAPPDYIKINSGLGEGAPKSIVVLPVLFEGEVKAVMELATFQAFGEIQLALLDQLAESIGIALNTIAATMRTEELLKQSQALAEKLQSQQEELTTTNKRLEQQAATLRTSEELLRTQQDQLQHKNDELQEKAILLAEQKSEVEAKNREVERARRALEDKAQQLELTSRYKSEFLANMSHELRTPLNNLLILAKMLSENLEQNLTAKQIRYSETIHASGQDLLTLINDILDLSRIESGNMLVEMAEIRLDDIVNMTESSFRPVAEEKKLAFEISLEPGIPASIHTDAARLQQVIKNLVANAFKFTEQGSVAVRFTAAVDGWTPGTSLDEAGPVIAIAVADTGIGIPAEKQRLIFEAFQQADGTTSRKYGGTGLGLSISREIVRALGGEIKLQSTVDRGSTFTVYLPVRANAPAVASRRADFAYRAEPRSPEAALSRPAAPANGGAAADVLAGMAENAFVIQEIEDDRLSIREDDTVVLIVENDVTFASLLMEEVHQAGLKGIIATRGLGIVPLTRQWKPKAITLDILLPDCSGFAVLEQLKRDPQTRHIPVHVISIAEDKARALALGAACYTQKSAAPQALAMVVERLCRSIQENGRNVLVVHSRAEVRQELAQLIGNGVVHCQTAPTIAEALAACATNNFDCIVSSTELGDGSVLDLLQQIAVLAHDGLLRVVVFAEEPLNAEQSSAMADFSNRMVVRVAMSQPEVFDITCTFLHRNEAELAPEKQQLLADSRDPDRNLAGRKLLIVDDDARNIFVITSALERAQLEIVYAENGRDALERMQNTAGIELVLMDIMMPEMDGYEAIRRIRKQFRSVPIIAVTAKAMMGDREKCIQAGASDYIAKPVDLDQLFSILRVWLPDHRTSAAARATGAQ